MIVVQEAISFMLIREPDSRVFVFSQNHGARILQPHLILVIIKKKSFLWLLPVAGKLVLELLERNLI